MALLRYISATKWGGRENRFQQSWTRDHCFHHGQVRTCDRNHDEGQCRQDAAVHRIAVKHNLGGNLGGNKQESPGTLEIPGLS